MLALGGIIKMLALLLNWRVWAGLLFVATLITSGLEGFKLGKDSEQSAFDAYKNKVTQQALQQQQQAILKESQLESSTTKVTNDYATKVTSTSSAISDLARLRHNQSPPSSILPSNSPATSSPSGTPEDGVLAECRDRRDELAGEAQQLSDQVTGLQAYIKGVLNGP
jgi:hypothetical protein